MQNLNRVTLEALSILKCVLEDQLEERYAYRNEIKRLTFGGLTLPFASLEHFLDRYGYLSIDQRSDTLNLSSSGLEAARHHEARLQSLDDDVLYHFAKEIQELSESDVSSRVHTGKRFDQHYIRFEGIGRGGLGSVWRAEHLKSGRLVAIKTLEGIDELVTSGRKSTIKKRLERVVRQLSTLSHPFICPVFDLSVHHTPPYYVMPLYQGGSLRDLLRQGPMSPEVALNLFYQVCLGLKHAHDRDVLHLDLKPENILIDELGNAKIFDFGMSHTIAKQVAQNGRHSYVGLGSVAYMAPELLRDAQLESVSVDIYGLGLILYEILVGELPGRRSPMPSEVIEGLPQPIDELFDMMTQDHPQQRPQSLDEVLTILNRVPPFDRLSTQSVVMTFTSSPLKLPGLKSLELPELEESADLKDPDRLMSDRSANPVAQSESRGVSSTKDDLQAGQEDQEDQDNLEDLASPSSADEVKESELSEPSDDNVERNASEDAQTNSESASHTSAPERSTALQREIASEAALSPQSLSQTQDVERAEPKEASTSSYPKTSSDQLRSRLQQITEVITPGSVERAEFESSRDVDTLTFDAASSSTAIQENELDSMRDEVLEELEELEELDESLSEHDVLSSAPVNYAGAAHLNNKEGHSRRRAGASTDFEDDDQTELKSARAEAKSPQADRLHQWPPQTTKHASLQPRDSESRSASPKRTSSMHQQIRERRERDQYK